MEISELITIIREDYLDDTFSGWESASDAEKADQFLWTDASLLRYLTEAQRQACNRTDFLYDDESFSITLVAGSPTYPISNLITRIEQVSFAEKTVAHVSKAQLQKEHPRWRTDSGIGTLDAKYTIRSRKLRMYPIPDAADAGGIVYLETYRLPLESITSASDELEIPDEYHRDLIWWVLYEAYSKQDADGYDKERGLMYLSQFEQVFGPVIDSRVRTHQLQEDSSATFAGVDYNSGSRLNKKESDADSVWYN